MKLVIFVPGTYIYNGKLNRLFTYVRLFNQLIFNFRKSLGTTMVTMRAGK